MPTSSPGGGAIGRLARIFRERASFEMRDEDVEALGEAVDRVSLGGGGGGGSGPAPPTSPPPPAAAPLPPCPGDAARLEAEAAETAAWEAAHPNALENFDAFASSVLSGGKRPAIFLDYDGTLTPIVRDPDAATLAPAMRGVVAALARVFPTAIVSGRGREKVESFVRLPELYYAGSHGMDIVGPAERAGGEAAAAAAAASASAATAASGATTPTSVPPPARTAIAFRPAADFAPLMDAAHAALAAAVAPIPGAAVEHNTFAVSVHYRNVDPAAWDDVAASVAALLAAPAFSGKLRAGRGRKVLEVRPTIDWDKGKALAHLLSALGLGPERGAGGGGGAPARPAATPPSPPPPSSPPPLAVAPDVVPIYLGDDRTDEDAFSALADAGVGAGVLVAARPRPTGAAWRLSDPGEVLAFLARLAAWGAGPDSGWHASPACTGWRLQLEGLTLPPLLDAAAARAAVAGGRGAGAAAAAAVVASASASASAGPTSTTPTSPAPPAAARSWPLAPDSPATLGRPPRPPSSADGLGGGGLLGPGRRTSSGSGAAGGGASPTPPRAPPPAPPSPSTTASQMPDTSSIARAGSSSDATSPGAAAAARAALAALKGGDGGGRGGGPGGRPPSS